MSYDCSVVLPHGAVGWSAVCDCGISGSYLLIFRQSYANRSALYMKIIKFNTITVLNTESLISVT